MNSTGTWAWLAVCGGALLLAAGCATTPSASSPTEAGATTETTAPTVTASTDVAATEQAEGASTNGNAKASKNASQWTLFDPANPMAWDPCDGAIRVVVDVDSIPARQSKKLAGALTDALQQWAKVSGLSFVDGGVVDVVYNAEQGRLEPANGVYDEHTIYLSLVDEGGLMSNTTVGLAGPTRTRPQDPAGATRITAADASFLRQYVYKASRAETTQLFRHEIGHALGLGHSGAKTDVMFPILSGQKRLGAGDVAGIRSLVHTNCSPLPS